MTKENDLTSIRRQVLTHFKCQQSGRCCKCPGVVMVNQQNIQDMARLKGETVDGFRRLYINKVRGWDVVASENHRPNCFLTPDNKCSVYEGRPKSCQTYPDWDVVWKSRDSILKELKICPGLAEAAKKINFGYD